MALNYIPQFRKLPNVPNTLMPGVVLSTTLSVSDDSGIIYFNNLTQNIDGINTENNTLITFKSIEKDNKQLYVKQLLVSIATEIDEDKSNKYDNFNYLKCMNSTLIQQGLQSMNTVSCLLYLSDYYGVTTHVYVESLKSLIVKFCSSFWKASNASNIFWEVTSFCSEWTSRRWAILALIFLIKTIFFYIIFYFMKKRFEQSTRVHGHFSTH